MDVALTGREWSVGLTAVVLSHTGARAVCQYSSSVQSIVIGNGNSIRTPCSSAGVHSPAMRIDHLEAVTKSDSVVLDKDYFWSIPPDERYDVYNTPADLTIGQLSDSLEFLKPLLADPDDALTYHLVWLADILRAIGEDNVG